MLLLRLATASQEMRTPEPEHKGAGRRGASRPSLVPVCTTILPTTPRMRRHRLSKAARWARSARPADEQWGTCFRDSILDAHAKQAQSCRMELLHFSMRYIWAIVWGWGGLAFGMLGIVEIIAWLFCQSGKWLRDWLGTYRWRVAIVLIVLAQATAYYDLGQQTRQVHTEQSPSPQSFGGSLREFNTLIGRDDWAVPWATNNVVVDWDTIQDYDAIAEITVRTYTGSFTMHPELKTAVRLKVVPDRTIVATQDIANKDGIVRLLLPRLEGRKEYQIEIKLYPDMQASVEGQVVFKRR